jgi:hypothetical protein
MKRNIVLACALLASSHYSYSSYEVHILKKGDTLSELLQSKGYSPLYGTGNWVEKTLELNHLTSEQDIAIKESYPIILPHRIDISHAEIIKDIVSTKKSSVLRKGLLANGISGHQKIKINFDYNQRTSLLNSSTVEYNQNFGLGLSIDGKNDYEISQLKYNFFGDFNIISHGSAKISKATNIANRIQPTYSTHFGSNIKAPQFSFEFGPIFHLEQKTRIEESTDDYIMRRDQTLSTGLQVSHIFEIDHLEYRLKGSYLNSLLQENFDTQKSFQMSQFSLMASVNLTNNYHIGAHYKTNQYSDIGIKSENIMGLNLIYDLN